jgi:hypothetical protein
VRKGHLEAFPLEIGKNAGVSLEIEGEHIGIKGLAVMLIGLTGLLTQLFLYNRRNK